MSTSALVVGNNPCFELIAHKDAVIWNITGADVQLYLRKPSGDVAAYTATITDGLNGVAHYESLVTDLDEPGFWTRSWRVTQGTLSLECVAIPFVVEDSPW